MTSPHRATCPIEATPVLRDGGARCPSASLRRRAAWTPQEQFALGGVCGGIASDPPALGQAAANRCRGSHRSPRTTLRSRGSPRSGATSQLRHPSIGSTKSGALMPAPVPVRAWARTARAPARVTRAARRSRSHGWSRCPPVPPYRRGEYQYGAALVHPDTRVTIVTTHTLKPLRWRSVKVALAAGASGSRPPRRWSTQRSSSAAESGREM